MSIQSHVCLPWRGVFWGISRGKAYRYSLEMLSSTPNLLIGVNVESYQFKEIVRGHVDYVC